MTSRAWFIGIIFGALGVWVVFANRIERQWASETEALAQQHVVVVAKSLWDYYPQGVEAYMQLALSLGGYEYIHVVDKTGEDFIRVENDANGYTGSWLVETGLIRRNTLSRDSI